MPMTILYVIFRLFVAVMVLGMVFLLLNWVRRQVIALFGERVPTVIAVCCLIAALKLWGLVVVLAILIYIGLGWAGTKWIRRLARRTAAAIRLWLVRRNEAALRRHLNRKCLRCGYMDEERWRAVLPAYADRRYPEPGAFASITAEFTAGVERTYITNDEKLTWLDPIVHQLVLKGMADIGQLVQVPSEGLAYTHATPDAKLIYDALENLCAAQKVEGQPILEKIVLMRDAVRSDLNLSYVPDYYLAAYKISDALLDRRRDGAANMIQREEISFSAL